MSGPEVSDDIGYYLAGFADGEGSFNFSLRPRPDYRIPWKLSVSFNVSQKERDILELFKGYLNCGTLRPRPDGVWYFEVTNRRDIVETIIPFFQRYRFLSTKKRRDFDKFVAIVSLMESGAHRHTDGLRQILQIRSDMNDGGKRRYSDRDVLMTLIESSETTRQAS